ncbi:XRE family transcriptional regulator [Brevibacillus laterosporus]|nr:XRE family transcriptional regulator [Brevibacillus laterosporus]
MSYIKVNLLNYLLHVKYGLYLKGNQLFYGGNLFEQYRIRKNISISELSENTGISKSVIYRVLNGETKHPSLSSCKKIMNALDIPLSEFIQAFIMLTQRPTTLQVLLTDAVTINDEELV